MTTTVQKQRPNLQEVVVIPEATGQECHVTLAIPGHEVHTSASLPRDQRERPRVVAATTLEALKGLGYELPHEVALARVLTIGEGRVAMVRLVAQDGSLFGTCEAVLDEDRAIAAATLDALNRHIAS
ncbi:MAG: hypothetical protein WDA71_04870 [Actinomycetota bacterium]